MHVLYLCVFVSSRNIFQQTNKENKRDEVLLFYFKVLTLLLIIKKLQFQCGISHTLILRVIF